MPRFRFRLDSVLKFRRAVREERRQKLAEAHEALRVLGEQMQQLHEEVDATRARLRTAAQPGRVDVDGLLEVNRYELILRARRQQLEQQLARVAAEVQRRREALVEADREVRVLEKLQQQQAELHRREQERIEIKLLDEVAQRQAALRKSAAL